VPGSLVLLGGSPGIGNSTLTGMALGNLAAAGRKTLYVSGEQSTAQVRMRAVHLGDGALAVPAVALAIVSAHRGETLGDPEGKPLACFGEVGLTGELRSVGHAERRRPCERRSSPRSAERTASPPREAPCSRCGCRSACSAA
jgi:predicted ATP-dependent serine protease